MIILLLLLRSLLSSLRLSRDNKRNSVRMGESERDNREKAMETVWEFKVNSLRIIIPQTIRSVIRIYLLWRMRDYDSGAVVYTEKTGDDKKGGDRI